MPSPAAGGGGTVVAVDPGPLRRLISEATPVSKRSDPWFWLYVAVLFGGFYGYAWVRTLQRSLAVPLAGEMDWIGAAIAVIVLVAGLAAARLGITVSPLSLSAPDATWLLPAPITRGRLLAPSFHRSLRSGAVLGFSAGVLCGIVLAPSVPNRWIATMTVAVVTFAMLGVMLTAVSVLIAASDRAARLVVRITPALVALAAALVLLGHQRPTLALLSGPWGWVGAPLAHAAGLDVAWWALGAMVLLAATTATVRGAHRITRVVHHEQLVRQAGVMSGLRASLYVGDLHTVGDVGRTTADRMRSRRDVRVPAPRRHALAIPWIDVLAVARSPARLAWSTIGAIVMAATLAVSDVDWGSALVVTLVGFGTVWMSLDVARLAFRMPEVAELLPVRPSTVVLRHSLVPIVSLSLVGAATAVGAMVAGYLEPVHVLPVIVMVGAAVPFLVLAQIAAFGAVPDEAATAVVRAGVSQPEFGGVGLIWRMAPAAVMTALLVPAVIVASAEQGLTAWQSARLALGFSVVATLTATMIAGWRLRARLDG